MNEDIFPFFLAFQLAVFGIVLLTAAAIRRHTREKIFFLAGLMMLCYGLENTMASSFILGGVDEGLPILFLWFRAIWSSASLVLGTLIVMDVPPCDSLVRIQFINETQLIADKEKKI